VIRLARSSDFPEITRIESDSGRLFREIGLDAVANEAPPTPEQLSAYRRRGIVWVATEENDRPIAYLMAEQVDLRGHIDQVTVSPDFSRRGIGGSLIEVAESWTVERRLAGVSLTTFLDVPWNAPYYRRLGFTVLNEEDWSPALRERVSAEAQRGLAVWPRVVMVKDL
jgi:ribosomal protein S18 acetylase RimI-like enzyme